MPLTDVTVTRSGYNGEPRVGPAIDSALRRADPDFAFVIAGDLSTDVPATFVRPPYEAREHRQP